MQFTKQHHHGTFSAASLAILTALVLPKTGLANEVTIPTPDNSPPPAAAVVDSADLSQLSIPSYQEYVESNPVPTQAQYRETDVEAAESVIAESESESAISIESIGTAAITTAGIAITALRKQIAKTVNSMFSSSLVNKAKSMVLGDKTKIAAAAEQSELGTFSLIMTHLEEIPGGYKAVKSPIPYKSEKLSDIFTNPKSFKIFEQALAKCTGSECLPALNLEPGENPGTFKGLDIVNNAIWENIAVTFNPDSKTYLNADKKAELSKFKIFIRCIQSDETDNTKSLEITLLSEEDFKILQDLKNKRLISEQDSQLPQSLRQLAEAENKRALTHPEKPIFPLVEVAV